MKSDKGTYIPVEIDGKRLQVPEGSTILDAATYAGIYIPTLCYLKGLKNYGGCRLCIVEVEGMARPISACTTPAIDDMVVVTESKHLYLKNAYLDE